MKTIKYLFICCLACVLFSSCGKYAHTINPQTGYPAEHHLLSATIVAPDAMMADAYATYCMVIGLEDAKEFIESNPELEGCLIYDDNGNFASWTSAGFILESL